MSYLPVKNEEKEPKKTLNPCSDKPEDMPIMFASAIPIWKNLSGNFLPKEESLVAPPISASRTTISLLLSPSMGNTSFIASLVAFIIFLSILSMLTRIVLY